MDDGIHLLTWLLYNERQILEIFNFKGPMARKFRLNTLDLTRYVWNANTSVLLLLFSKLNFCLAGQQNFPLISY